MIEIRIDGVGAEAYSSTDRALEAALNLKRDLPQQSVTLHDHRFERAWVVRDDGHVHPHDYPPTNLTRQAPLLRA